jgi:hypothetical protein
MEKIDGLRAHEKEKCSKVIPFQRTPFQSSRPVSQAELLELKKRCFRDSGKEDRVRLCVSQML